MPPFDNLGVGSYSTSVATIELWPYLAPFPRYTDLLVKNRPIFSPLLVDAPVMGEAVGVKKRPLVTKNSNDGAIRW